MPNSLSVRSSSYIIAFLGFLVGILWLTFFSQIGILSFVDTFAAFFGPLFGLMIADYYFIQKGKLDNKDIQEIFENIDKIEDIQDIDNYLPADLRITKNEYHQAMVDEVYRTQTLVKIKTALTVLSQQSWVSNQSWVNLFTGFLSLLDKNLVLIQEHNIDMKNNLEKIDNNKNNTHTSIWKSIKDFFKEVLQ